MPLGFSRSVPSNGQANEPPQLTLGIVALLSVLGVIVTTVVTLIVHRGVDGPPVVPAVAPAIETTEPDSVHWSIHASFDGEQERYDPHFVLLSLGDTGCTRSDGPTCCHGDVRIDGVADSEEADGLCAMLSSEARQLNPDGHGRVTSALLDIFVDQHLNDLYERRFGHRPNHERTRIRFVEH